MGRECRQSRDGSFQPSLTELNTSAFLGVPLILNFTTINACWIQLDLHIKAAKNDLKGLKNILERFN